jgi:GntR family transcriptional regulator
VQIAETLLDRIETGDLRPGDRLPSERDLSEQLGVNRTTLRQGLQILELRGLVRREQGNGTFIARPRLDREAAEIFRFTKGIARRGLTPGAKLVSLEQRLVESSMARELSVPLSSRAYFLMRLRTINQEPVMLERYLIPVQRAPKLEEHDLEARSVFEILESEYGLTIHRARQTLEPVIATDFEAEVLQVEPGSPLMMERRLSFNEAGEPLESGKDLYRGDRFRFVTESAPFEF